MDVHQHHETLIEGISEQQRTILEDSEQGIYIYLDDHHKVCNQKFAEMLGFVSPMEWADVREGFTLAFVDEDSQRALVSAYRSAMSNLVGSSFEVTWKNRRGGRVQTRVILVPIVYDGHLFALHFVS